MIWQENFYRFNILYARRYNPRYIYYPIFEVNFLIFKEFFFSENSVLMYG